MEILKAQMKTKGRVTYQVETAAMPMPEVSKSTDRLKLPIKNIKKDLVKTLGFAIFAVVVLVVLHFKV